MCEATVSISVHAVGPVGDVTRAAALSAKEECVKLNPTSETVRDLGRRMLTLCKEMAGPSEEIELFLTLERGSLNITRVKDGRERVMRVVPMGVRHQ